MTTDRGDVVLLSFVFSDGTGTKLRPAVVVSSRAYHRSRQEAIVAAVTSNVSTRRAGDTVLREWKAAGLLFPSIVTGILRTVKRDMIARRLGALPATELTAVDHALRTALAL